MRRRQRNRRMKIGSNVRSNKGGMIRAGVVSQLKICQESEVQEPVSGFCMHSDGSSIVVPDQSRSVFNDGRRQFLLTVISVLNERSSLALAPRSRLPQGTFLKKHVSQEARLSRGTSPGRE
jgi:hypothetical protein